MKIGRGSTDAKHRIKIKGHIVLSWALVLLYLLWHPNSYFNLRGIRIDGAVHLGSIIGHSPEKL